MADSPGLRHTIAQALMPWAQDGMTPTSGLPENARDMADAVLSSPAIAAALDVIHAAESLRTSPSVPHSAEWDDEVEDVFAALDRYREALDDS